MRVAFLTHQWPGIRMGGIGAATRQTAAALAAAGHDVHVFTFAIPQDARSTVPAGVHFHESPDLAARVQQGDLASNLAAAIDAAGEGGYRLALAWLLCDVLLKQHNQCRFDVIEAPEVEALALPLMLHAHFDAPVITHLHCCTALAQQANGSPHDVAGNLTTALEFAAIHLADSLCAPTRAVVAAMGQFITIAQSVAIVPHPCTCPDTAFTPPPPGGAILFIGRIEQLKGVIAIAHALNHFLPKHPSAHFHFIGPDTSTAPGGGSMREHLQSLLNPRIASRVLFTGELSSPQIQRELQAASFVVQPSLCENFSMTCCEALAAGRTLIVGEKTGSVELVADAGLVIDPQNQEALAQAMEQLWVDRALLVRLSQRARERIGDQFSPAQIAVRRVDFYQQAADAFQERKRTDLATRLSTLPCQVAAAVLPAFCTLTGVLTGALAQPQSPGQRLLSIMERLSAATNEPAQVLLYGAGKFTSRLLAQRAIWESKRHKVIGLIDDHPRFSENASYLDLPVQSIATAQKGLSQGRLLPPVVLSTDTYQDQFWSQTQALRDCGVKVFRL